MIMLALGVTAFVVTLAGGLFVLSAVDRAGEFLSFGSSEDEPQIRVIPSRTGELRWEPLRLEPYKMPWPSETEYARRKLPEMRWPSESWDDPYFGPKGKRFAVTTPTSLTGNERLNDEVPEAHRTRRATRATTPRPQPARQQPVEQAFFQRSEHEIEIIEPTPSSQKEREPAVGDRMAAIALEQARRERQRPKPKPKPKPAPRPVADSGLPEAEVLRGWVEQYGLAGAVSKLRTQTGWDFQKAARYLAQQVSGRR